MVWQCTSRQIGAFTTVCKHKQEFYSFTTWLPCSSCPDAPAICNWDTCNSTEPNFHTLTGAVVGGPDSNDNYVDSRQEPVQNMVACDNNAAFQSAVAALVDLQL